MDNNKIKITLIYNKNQTFEFYFENDYRKIKRKINEIFNITSEDNDVTYYFFDEEKEEHGYYNKKDHNEFLKQKDKKIYVINKNPNKEIIEISDINNKDNIFLYKIVGKLFSNIEKKLLRIKYLKYFDKIREYVQQIKIEREKRKMKIFQLINDKKFIYKMKNLKIENEEKYFFDSNSNYFNNNFIINVKRI